MPDRHQFARVGLDVELGRDAYAPPPVPQADTAFCVALVGDFGGRRDTPIRERTAALVDVDDLDRVMARVAPELALDLGPEAGATVVRFTSLDDFHPDRLYERLPLFEALRETRRRLADPSTFAAAAAQLRAPEPAPDSPAPSTRDVAGALAGGSLLDSILDAAAEPDAGAGAAPRDSPDALQAFIRRAVRSHLVPTPDPRQGEMLESVDAAIAELLRAVLRHPRLRALEAAWRGVDMLVRRTETGPRLRVALVDVGREELAADLAATDDPRATETFALLAGAGARFPEPAPWGAIAGLHTFHPARHAALLDRLARLGATLGAPWLSAADDAVAAPPPMTTTRTRTRPPSVHPSPRSSTTRRGPPSAGRRTRAF